MSRQKRKSTSLVSTNGVVPQLQQALNRADAFIGALASTATTTIKSLQKQSSLAIEGLRTSLDSINKGSLSGVQDTAKATVGYVRKHPWQSAAVAVGVGVTAVVLRDSSRRVH